MNWIVSLVNKGVSPTLLCCLILVLSPYEMGAQEKPVCTIVPTNRTLVNIVSRMIWRSVRILEDLDVMRVPAYIISYHLEFPNRNKGDNPLAKNLKYVYRPNKFVRVLNRHGMTLLTLAFNYGVTSLYSLRIGTHEYTLTVAERPALCLNGLNASDTMNVVLYLLARDLNLTNANASIRGDERICYETIEEIRGLV